MCHRLFLQQKPGVGYMKCGLSKALNEAFAYIALFVAMNTTMEVSNSLSACPDVHK